MMPHTTPSYNKKEHGHHGVVPKRTRNEGWLSFFLFSFSETIPLKVFYFHFLLLTDPDYDISKLTKNIQNFLLLEKFQTSFSFVLDSLLEYETKIKLI